MWDSAVPSPSRKFSRAGPPPSRPLESAHREPRRRRSSKSTTSACGRVKSSPSGDARSLPIASFRMRAPSVSPRAIIAATSAPSRAMVSAAGFATAGRASDSGSNSGSASAGADPAFYRLPESFQLV